MIGNRNLVGIMFLLSGSAAEYLYFPQDYTGIIEGCQTIINR
jgi:hypothetical protein